MTPLEKKIRALKDEPPLTTPEYTRRAVKAYREKTKQKQVTFNTEKKGEAELLAHIEADAEPFSTLVKKLLEDHYRPAK